MWREIVLRAGRQSRKMLSIGIAVLAVLAVIAVAACAIILVGGSGRKLKKQLSVANSYMDDEEYKKAVAEFKKAIEIDEKCVEAYMGIAEAYTEMAEEADDTEDAASYYEKAIKYLKKGYKATDNDDFNDEIKAIEKKIDKIAPKPAAAAPAMETPAVEEAAPAAEAVAEAPAAEYDGGWIDKYIDFVNENREYFSNYTFIYVNDDSIPELVAAGTDEATGCLIATYGNGEIDSLKTARLYYEYESYRNVLNNSGGHMGYYYDYLYTITDGKWVEIAAGEYGDEPLYDGNGEIVDYGYANYTWNGVPVSEKEYYTNLDAYYDRARVSSYYDPEDSWHSADEMIGILDASR